MDLNPERTKALKADAAKKLREKGGGIEEAEYEVTGAIDYKGDTVKQKVIKNPTKPIDNEEQNQRMFGDITGIYLDT